MGHPLDDVMDGLLALVCPDGPDRNGVMTATAAGLDGVLVLDGQQTDDPSEPEFLGIGLAIDEAADAFGDDTQGWGRRRDTTYQIGCLAQVWAGDTEMAPRRRRVLQILDAFRALLLADETVGGSCTRAWLESWRYQGEQSSIGSTALVQFTVAVNAVRFEGE